jgi:YfiH family protein
VSDGIPAKAPRYNFMAVGFIEICERFKDIGILAGVVLKGSWESQKDIYDKMESEMSLAANKIVIPRQRHGSDIAIVDDSEDYKNPIADGLLSLKGGCCLTIRTADCLPMLLADPLTGLIGAVHIGWRSLAGGIVENLRLKIKKLDINFDRLYIHLGPAIGECCFEVGGDVAVLFDDEFVRESDGRFFLDVRGLVRNKLLSFGVSNNAILETAECTSCLDSKYYSFRRDREATIQMVSFICKRR